VNDETSNDTSTQKGLLRIKFLQVTISVVLICAAAFLVWLYGSHFGWELSPKQETWGQFGDYVGGLLNPLVGFFTVALLLLSLHLQNQLLKGTREQLAVSRQELELTRKEMEKSAEALVEQSATFKAQQSDAWFFELLKMRSVMIAGLRAIESSGLKNVPGIQIGAGECFRAWVDDLFSIHLNDYVFGSDSVRSTEQQFVDAAKDLLARNTNSLLPYLRFMDSFLLQLQDIESLESRARKVALLTSQIGEDEATCLGCYVLSKDSAELNLRFAQLGVIGEKITSEDREALDAFDNVNRGFGHSALHGKYLSFLKVRLASRV